MNAFFVCVCHRKKFKIDSIGKIDGKVVLLILRT